MQSPSAAGTGAAVRAHWLLDPDVVFLNHGSFGACPRPVLAAQDRWRQQLEREPVQFMVHELEPALDRARGALAAFLGVDPLDVAFVTNATTGVNAVVQSLRLQPGDELLTTDHAYNACRNALHWVADPAGARVVVARVPFPLADPQQVVDAVTAAVTPRTVLALLDHVTSPTGLVLPVAAIAAALHARGVPTLVDGAHAPGMLDLDISALGAAYYTGNCHKWLCTPKGSAFLWVRRDLHPHVRPVTISHGANSARTDRSRFLCEFDLPGTYDPTALLVLPDALAWLGALLPGGWPALRAHNHALVQRGRDLLCEALAVPAPAPDAMLGSLAAVPLPPWSGPAARQWQHVSPLQAALRDRFHIQVPITTWPAPPQRWVRISAQVYNHMGEYEQLAAALRTLLDGEARAR